MKVRINPNPLPPLADPKKSLFDHIFGSIFSSTLNDPEIGELVAKLENEESPVVELMSSGLPIGIGSEVFLLICRVLRVERSKERETIQTMRRCS